MSDLAVAIGRPPKSTIFTGTEPDKLENRKISANDLVSGRTRPADRAEWSFGELLEWHLLRGTRHDGSRDKMGTRWRRKVFAGAVGYDERTIRNWLKNDFLTSRALEVERVLFGDNPAYKDWRFELKAAFERSRQIGSSKSVHKEKDIDLRSDKPRTIANIPIRIPKHFMGRDDALAAIDAGLARKSDGVTVVALHGLPGVGKTVLAAAYANQHRIRFHTTWWIRAQTLSSLRTDFVSLGVRLGCATEEQSEQQNLDSTMERLWHAGEGVLLIYDNAPNADTLKSYLPRGGACAVLVTSKAHDWRSVAETVEIHFWPKEVGAAYLIACLPNSGTHHSAAVLSAALGGLPLAHEQAAAYCERLGVSFSQYHARFDAAPLDFLSDDRYAQVEYNDRQTVTKTVSLAIEEAAKLHPLAEPLIVHAALLPPEPIPLFLFTFTREALGKRFAVQLANNGLSEAVAALRTFAMIDKGVIVDERDEKIESDAISLHPLVRQIAAARRTGKPRDDMRRRLIEALALLCPSGVSNDSNTWPLMRCLECLALPMLYDGIVVSKGFEKKLGALFMALGQYRHIALSDYKTASFLYEQAIKYREQALGADHPATAHARGALAKMKMDLGDYDAAGRIFESLSAINETAYGPADFTVADSLNSFAMFLQDSGDLDRAIPIFEKALAINELAVGPNHPRTATILNNLGCITKEQRNFVQARALLERALSINEKVFGPHHIATATSLSNLGHVVAEQGDFVAARALLERSFVIHEGLFGLANTRTALALGDLSKLVRDQGDLVAARNLYRQAVSIYEDSFGGRSAETIFILIDLASILMDEDDLEEAKSVLEQGLAASQDFTGRDAQITVIILNNLADLYDKRCDLAMAGELLARALSICELEPSVEAPMCICLHNLGVNRQRLGDSVRAQSYLERALTVAEATFGPDHLNVAQHLHNLADLHVDNNNIRSAIPLLERGLAIREKILGPCHRDTIKNSICFAFVLLSYNELCAAKNVMERLLLISEGETVIESLQIAEAFEAFGKKLWHRNDRCGAQPFLEMALSLYQKELGPEHDTSRDALLQFQKWYGAAMLSDGKKVG